MSRTPAYAPFWARLAAVLIDWVILTMAQLIIAVPIGIILALGMQSEAAINAAANLVGILVGIPTGWLYEALLTSSSRQATVGKMALSIKVTDVNMERISFARATGRHFGKYLSGMILLIGYLMQPFTERKQALHDIVAGTLVVKK